MQKLSLISVEPEPLPSFREVMAVLGPLVPQVYESLEAGAAVCRRYYEELSAGVRPEPYLREMMIRSQAKLYLTQSGLQVKGIREPKFNLASEPLLSLLIHYQGFAIRVLKAKRGISPGCGRSKRRKNFYNQVPVSYINEEGKPTASKYNLLAFWDFSSTFGVGSVWLACPEVAGARPQDVVLAWQELIPNPVTQRVPVTETQAETLQRENEADQEIERLLLGPKNADPSNPNLQSSFDENQLAKRTSNGSENEIEEEDK
jgi:hypothetical protein